MMKSNEERRPTIRNTHHLHITSIHHPSSVEYFGCSEHHLIAKKREINSDIFNSNKSVQFGFWIHRIVWQAVVVSIVRPCCSALMYSFLLNLICDVAFVFVIGGAPTDGAKWNSNYGKPIKNCLFVRRCHNSCSALQFLPRFKNVLSRSRSWRNEWICMHFMAIIEHANTSYCGDDRFSSGARAATFITAYIFNECALLGGMDIYLS